MSRSSTSWRARIRSVPGSKISSTDDSCGTDLERIDVEAGDPVERLLQRDGHQRLDLLRREAEAGRLDLDPRRGELGEHVDRDVAHLGEPEEHQRRGQRHDDEAEPQARADDRPEHRPRPPFSPAPGTVVPARSFAFDPSSAPSSSVAPTVTTSAPVGGPSDRTATSPRMKSMSMAWRTKTFGSGLVKVHVAPSMS